MKKLRPLRILVAEGRQSGSLREAFASVPDTQVEAVATDGLQAVALTRELHPDAVVIDAHTTRIDGFEATRRIMWDTPTPIVIVAENIDNGEVEVSMEALRAGALAAVLKPRTAGTAEFAERSEALVKAVRMMADVKVVRRWPDRPGAVPAPVVRPSTRPSIVAIGASTGGPAAIHEILARLPGDFPLPVVVTQHIAAGFAPGMVRWLSGAGPMRVKVAEDGEGLSGGVVYVAADDRHLVVTPQRTISLSNAPPSDGHRPSATVMFRSVAESYRNRALAVILTGMGHDGTAGLETIHKNGGVVLAQDEASSVVFGMPASAIERGVADAVLPLDAIASQIVLVSTPIGGS